MVWIVAGSFIIKRDCKLHLWIAKRLNKVRKTWKKSKDKICEIEYHER